MDCDKLRMSNVISKTTAIKNTKEDSWKASRSDGTEYQNITLITDKADLIVRGLYLWIDKWTKSFLKTQNLANLLSDTQAQMDGVRLPHWKICGMG